MQTVFDPNHPRCVECGGSIETVLRPQGGGRYKKYCSSKCRSNSWARGHTQSRQLSILKYDTKPENKQKKRERTYKAKFKKYNITEEIFLKKLLQQEYKCQICNSAIDKYTARIDHNHITGTVRELLCDHCNWALGHAKDNISILNNMIKYLERYND